MVMIATFTAAEIAAAEAAAIAAAEAAATEAAIAAAAEAAAAEAATAAAASTATTAGTTAAVDAGITGVTNAGVTGATNAGITGATDAGITQIGAGSGGAGASGINAAQVAEQQAIAQGGGQGITQASAMSPQQQAYLNASTAGPAPSSMPLQSTTGAGTNPYANLQTNTGFGQAPVEPININAPGMNTNVPTVTEAGVTQPAAQPSAFERGFDKFSTFADKHPYMTAGLGYMGAYNMGLLDPRNNGGVPEGKYDGPLKDYRLSSNFKGNTANPEDYRYTPRYAAGGIMGAGPVEQMSNQNAIGANTGYPMADTYAGTYATPFQTPVSQNVVSGSQDVAVDPYTGQQQFAAGGIAHFAKGNLASSLDYYTNMMDGHNERRALPEKSDVGLYHDMDPDTRYQDALTAAQIRQAKVNKRANMQGADMKRPTPMGQLNLRPPGAKREEGGSTLDPENAAQGGIMQARGHLGGYAAGGNPRLLKGPGDGMSDNIPATIAGKQPARLADGEFVVPADVVSHLGNGSTEAGAKKLHQMMTQVRKARTGNPKQGKQINPNKFTPK